MARAKIFISYSHQDKKWLEKIKIHLRPYQRNMPIEIWDDSQIRPGNRWREDIEKALKSANVAVLLVSPNFLSSDFIAEHELSHLLNAAKKEGLTIVWVPVSSSAYEETDIAHYQAVHDPNKPLDKLSQSEQNEALVRICREIKAILTEHEQADENIDSSIAKKLGTSLFNTDVERILRHLSLHTVFSPVQSGFVRSPLEMIKEEPYKEDLTAVMAKIPSFTNLKEQIRFVKSQHFADKYAGSWVDEEVQLIGTRVLQDIETHLTNSCRFYDAGSGNYGQYKAILSVLGKDFAHKGEYCAQDYNNEWESFFKIQNGQFLIMPLPKIRGKNFDLVSCAHVLQDMASNLIAVYATVFSFNEVLKKNGICYITVPCKDAQPGMLDVLETAARDGGFQILNSGHRRLVMRGVVERYDPLGITTFSQIILRKTNNIDIKFWKNLLGASFFRWKHLNFAEEFGIRTEGDIDEHILLIERDLGEVLVERNYSVRTFRWIINRLLECKELWQETIRQRSKGDVAVKIREHIQRLHDEYIDPQETTLQLDEICSKYLFWLLLWLFQNCQPINKQTILSIIDPVVKESFTSPRDVRVHIDDLSRDQIARLIRHLFQLCELKRINIRQGFHQYILERKSLNWE